MAVDLNSIYKIQLDVTGSGVQPGDNLQLQLSGSLSGAYQSVAITGSVVEWQDGQSFTGSVLIGAYEEVTGGSPATVFAARLKNTTGVCNGEVSNQFSFIVEQTCFSIILEFTGETAIIEGQGCSFISTGSVFFMDNANFAEATTLYLDGFCTEQTAIEDEPAGYAPEGFYHTNGGLAREVTLNGSLGNVINCGVQ